MGWVSAISKLIEFFAKLKQKDMNSLTVVVMGKGGVGKSSTVNSLIGEQVVRVSPFQAEGLRPVMVSKTSFLFASSLHSLHIILKYKTPTNKNDVLDQVSLSV
ncbi:hypothetical protein F2Q70_00015909 [Brassica cretica]|uniref:AIG1-type G domain-containing protein n=1 Tax=Brassica cretica TaxID=69181 RepID=A0A8S9HWW9_BRACR|nr:hypothetical protein F2Q70_00015909 [Brassica cretica]